MSKRLFVGGLPYDMTEDKLTEVFTACGRVEKVKIMVDRASGRSKGFGFVEMATDLEGDAAILKFDNTQLGPRKISVKEARPAENHHKPAGGQRPTSDQTRGRQPNDHRGKDRRFSNNNGGGQRNEGFGEARPPRGPQGYGDRPHRGGQGRTGNGNSEQGSFGGGFGRRNQGRPPIGQGMGVHRERNTSDWRSELGLGNGQPQRRDFRRNNNAPRDGRRSQPRDMDDNFGNR